MSNIKKFVDKIAIAESRNAREIVLTLSEAKELRDEITKVLVDNQREQTDDVIHVEMRGSKW